MGTHKVLKVGLTGGLASGKSSVARRLGQLGAPVLDADEIVHQLYRPGEAGARAVYELFGKQLMTAEGAVDRVALGRLVTSDRRARTRLDSAVHPLVREQIAAWLDELDQRPSPPLLAIIEAALLVETGSYRDYDVLVVVWCRPDQQLSRAIARGMDGQRARGLIAAQLPLDEKRHRAHIKIANTADEQHLDTEVRRAWQHLMALCQPAEGRETREP
jgi:dephospho-CoA kinase